MIYHPDTTDFPGGQEQFIRDYTPSAGRMFSEGIDAGFRDVSFMLAKSVMDMDAAENAPLLTKEDWETSKSRKGAHPIWKHRLLELPPTSHHRTQRRPLM